MTRATDSQLGENRLIWKQFRYHSKTFSLATLFLPRHIRTPVATLYMFCRMVDEIADRVAPEEGAEAALDRLRETEKNLNATIAGQPPDGLLWRRLAEVDQEFDLESGPMEELIAGARWDLEGRPILDESDLVRYSNLVGGSIGAMMLPLLGDLDAGETDRRARDLGIGMQITNIVRDVGEDLRVLSRSYIPLTLAQQVGVDPQRPNPSSPSYQSLLERMMAMAEERFTSGLLGIKLLPAPMRPGIRAATRLYRQILNEVRRNRYDNVTRRAFVPWYRKVSVIAFDDYVGRKRRLSTPT